MTRRKIDWSLYLVTDRALCGTRSLEDVVLAAIRGGATAVQLREKSLPTREFVELGKRLKDIVSRHDVPLIINDRADVALACRADGVHIGQTDLQYADARALLGKDAIVGLSVETEDQALEAEAWDLDYLGISPIFETKTKVDAAPAWGLERLARLNERTRHSLVAIGGIDVTNACRVVQAGADGLAVVSAICASLDPEAAARALRFEIDEARTNDTGVPRSSR